MVTTRVVPCAPVRGAAWACPRSVLRGDERDARDRLVPLIVIGDGDSARVILSVTSCRIARFQRRH